MNSLIYTSLFMLYLSYLIQIKRMKSNKNKSINQTALTPPSTQH